MSWGLHFLFFATMLAMVTSTPRAEWMSNGLTGMALTLVGVWCDKLPAHILSGKTTSPFAIFFCSMVFLLAAALGEKAILEYRREARGRKLVTNPRAIIKNN